MKGEDVSWRAKFGASPNASATLGDGGDSPPFVGVVAYPTGAFALKCSSACACSAPLGAGENLGAPPGIVAGVAAVDDSGAAFVAASSGLLKLAVECGARTRNHLGHCRRAAGCPAHAEQEIDSSHPAVGRRLARLCRRRAARAVPPPRPRPTGEPVRARAGGHPLPRPVAAPRTRQCAAPVGGGARCPRHAAGAARTDGRQPDPRVLQAGRAAEGGGAAPPEPPTRHRPRTPYAHPPHHPCRLLHSDE